MDKSLRTIAAFRMLRLLAILPLGLLGGCVAYAPPYDAGYGGYGGYYGGPAYAAPPVYAGPYIDTPLILDFGFVSGGHRGFRGGHRGWGGRGGGHRWSGRR